MKLKNVKAIPGAITREQAMAICPDYVAFVEGNFDKFEDVFDRFNKASKGQEAITALEQDGTTVYVRGTISYINHDDFRAVDGPIVRFSGGGYTWRVDGDKYAHLLPKGLKACRAAVDACLAMPQSKLRKFRANQPHITAAEAAAQRAECNKAVA